MNPEVNMKVKVVIPGITKVAAKDAFDYFMQQWKNNGKRPFNGEYTLQNPDGKNPGRAMTIEPSNISHQITDIDNDTYDPKTGTIMMKVRFTGPKSPKAIDEFIKNKIHLMARSVKGNDKITGEPVTRIVTWDLVHAPDNAAIDRAIRDPKVQAALSRRPGGGNLSLPPSYLPKK